MSPFARKPSPTPPTDKPSAAWSTKAMNLSDKWGAKFNDYAADKWGLEAFWPTTGDFPREMEKAARILKGFTIDEPDPEDKHGHKQAVRIPPSVIAQAKGLAIYTCARTGVAPMGGSGGSGLVVARLPNGSWSAPAAILPTAMGAGMQIGVDVYNAVLVIRTEAALAQFGTHRVALGGEVSVAAGPYGGGNGIEGGDRGEDNKAAVFSYMKARGAYFGIEVVGTVFVSRSEENARMYHWPNIKAADILAGKVAVPPEASSLMQALRSAEMGVAQSPNVATYGPGFAASAASKDSDEHLSGYYGDKAKLRAGHPSSPGRSSYDTGFGRATPAQSSKRQPLPVPPRPASFSHPPRHDYDQTPRRFVPPHPPSARFGTARPPERAGGDEPPPPYSPSA